jgi:hypothetical protein
MSTGLTGFQGWYPLSSADILQCGSWVMTRMLLFFSDSSCLLRRVERRRHSVQIQLPCSKAP